MISCFNTSHVVIYLSLLLCNVLICLCFNTSHVVIYQKRGIPMAQSIIRFNTSHVVIYLGHRVKHFPAASVSIHLILLFIQRYNAITPCTINVSIHLMLLFIKERGTQYRLVCRFQYISCCYLSQFFFTACNGRISFNTSRVVIYQWRKWK